MHRRSTLLSLSLLASLFLAPAAAAQGPAPGIKPIAISSLPFTISSSGTYYLYGSLTGVAGQDGIRINASNVNLNLNGHHLRGVPGSRSGIVVNLVGTKSITIQNGTLSGWSDFGIEASLAQGMHVDGVVAIQNGLSGMQLGSNALVQRCTSSSNSGVGFQVGDNSALESCLAVGNQGHGVFAGSNARVSDCTATGNNGEGIIASGESLVRDSLAIGNKRSGIRVGPSTSVLDCNAARNEEHGIVVVHHSRVSGCTASLNGNGQNPASVGILAEGTSSFIEGNQTVFNGIGYRALGPLNFFSGNTSQSEVGFQLNAGNVAGPILTSAALATATNPTSNFDL